MLREANNRPTSAPKLPLHHARVQKDEPIPRYPTDLARVCNLETLPASDLDTVLQVTEVNCSVEDWPSHWQCSSGMQAFATCFS
jgi:hypothetical protein